MVTVDDKTVVIHLCMLQLFFCLWCLSDRQPQFLVEGLGWLPNMVNEPHLLKFAVGVVFQGGICLPWLWALPSGVGLVKWQGMFTCLWAMHTTHLGLQPVLRSMKDLAWATMYQLPRMFSEGLDSEEAVCWQEGFMHSAFFLLELSSSCSWKQEMSSNLLPHCSTKCIPCPVVEAYSGTLSSVIPQWVLQSWWSLFTFQIVMTSPLFQSGGMIPDYHTAVKITCNLLTMTSPPALRSSLLMSPAAFPFLNLATASLISSKGGF